MTALWNAADLRAATAGVMAGEFAASGVAIDSRGLVPGDLFIALHAARDGHAFVTAALRKGAAGAMVDHRPADLPNDAPLLMVKDTLAALGALGAYGRARATGKVFAITGSVGKTTTKEMLRAILAAQTSVHAAEASYNNHWGVPLTLARIPPDSGAAVVEIGMNHAGEIAPLARLARPHAAIITAIAPAHLGNLGSLRAIAEEKASLLEAVIPGGVAVVPAESEFLPLLREAARGLRVITFGAGGEARLVACVSDPAGSIGTVAIGGKKITFRLNVAGRHMAVAALAALAASDALGFDAEAGAEALEGFRGLAGRGARREIRLGAGAVTLLDESYNASPASLHAALGVLAMQRGRRIAVLGDMLELGASGPAAHAALASHAAACADLVFTCGPLMEQLFTALPAARQGAAAPDADHLAPLVLARLRAGDVVLVKGSLGSRMRVITALLTEGAR